MTDKIFRYGFFILLGAVIIIYIFKGMGDKSYIRELENKVELLEQESAKIEEENIALELSVSSLKDTLAIVDTRASELEKKRLEAIKYYEKKLSNIDNFTTVELDSFFIARYGHLLRGSAEGDSN